MEEIRHSEGRRQGKACKDRIGVRVILQQRKHESRDLIKVTKEQGADRNVPSLGVRTVLDGKFQANYAIHLKSLLS